MISNRYNEALLDTILSNGRIPNVLVEIIPSLKRNGSGYTAPVPWREDIHPSLGLFCSNDGAWVFKDRAMDDSGNAIQLVQKITGKGFPESVQWLADRLNIALPENGGQSKPSLAPASTRIDRLEKLYVEASNLDGTAAAQYLDNRGLLETAKALGVRCYEPGEPRQLSSDAYESGMGVLSSWAQGKYGFLVYPAKVNGRLIAHRCRLLMNMADARRKNFKANHWTPIAASSDLGLPTTWPTLPETLPKQIVLTEGETDCLAVRTLVESTQAFAILGTGGLSDKTKEFKQITKQKPDVILAFQRDDASAKKAAKLIDQLGRYGVSCRAVVPAGGANDWAKVIEWDQCPVDSLDTIAARLGDHSVSRSFDALNRHLDALDAGTIKTIPVFWKTINWAFGGSGIPPATVGLLAAKTGRGKTWAVLNWVLAIAGHNKSSGLPVFILNTEMPERSVGLRLLALASGNKDVLVESNTDLIREIKDEYQTGIDRLPMEITPPDPRSIEDALNLLEAKAKDHKFLVVDHIGELSFEGKHYDALPKFAKRVCGIAQRTGAVILMVTHLKANEAGIDMLAYSRQIENVVDWSLSLGDFSDKESKEVTVSSDCGRMVVTANRMMIIRKNRYGISDTRIAFDFSGETLAMNDLGRILSTK